MSYLDTRSPLKKAMLGKLKFQFNPNTITYEGGSDFATVRGVGMSYPLFSYTGGRESSLSFEIYLNDRGNSYNNLPTAKFCETLHEYRYYGDNTTKVQGEYKPILFTFGDKVYKCLVSSVSVQYLAFDRTLTPIEANVSVTLTILK